MRVLLDNNVNHRFGALLTGHEVIHARRLGWADMANGRLVAAAEEARFDALVTCDKNMSYQQNLRGRRLSILVLNSVFLKLPSIAVLAPRPVSLGSIPSPVGGAKDLRGLIALAPTPGPSPLTNHKGEGRAMGPR